MSTPGRISKLAVNFLNELHAPPNQDLIDSLDLLLQEIEEISDPDSYMISLVENIYQFQEKLKTLQTNLNNYVKNKRKNTPGFILESLINNTRDDLFSEGE